MSCGKYRGRHIIQPAWRVVHSLLPRGGEYLIFRTLHNFFLHEKQTDYVCGFFTDLQFLVLQVDNLINQNHLFKRSIILIKAWCYYESRILGAHHGLISTYALETLVLYIFHVFNNSFAGPLEVTTSRFCILFVVFLHPSIWKLLLCLCRSSTVFWSSLVSLIGTIFVLAYGVLYPLVHFQM